MPASTKLGQTARSAAGRGKHGGVAIWTKEPLSSLPVGRDAFCATVLHQTARFCTTAIALGNQRVLAAKTSEIQVRTSRRQPAF